MKAYQLRMQIKDDNDYNEYHKCNWLKIRTEYSPENIIEFDVKNYYISLARGNPRIAVFEYCDEKQEWKKIYQEKIPFRERVSCNRKNYSKYLNKKRG